MSTLPGPASPATRLRGRDLLRVVAEGTAGAVGDAFLRSLVTSLAAAFGARLAFVAEADDPSGAHVRHLACWYDGGLLEELPEYDTAGQPCALMTEQAVVAFPAALQERFPEDREAIEMGLQSYLAVCLRSADGTHLGHLAVLDTQPMEAGEEDVAALQIFASRAAAELERRRQAAALRASRARLVEVADEERRRFGRDLHDGAQQRLLAVSNLLALARAKAGPDVAPLLERAAEELTTAHGELRELARGLHPVALAERGLRSALTSLTASCPVPVRLEVDDAPLPDGVAMAAYFVVAEALANAARHACAEEVRVRVAAVDGQLVLDVDDDGCGGADPAGGTGLLGLADRVAAAGGTLDVDSPSGAGTRLRAVLPVG